MKIFFDGGARPNPGPMETAVVARGIVYHRAHVGTGSNNAAEWCALVHGLEIARQIGATDIVLLGDSRLVIAQANGLLKCRTPDLQRHFAAFEAACDSFARVRVRYVKRTQNLAGIALDTRRR